MFTTNFIRTCSTRIKHGFKKIKSRNKSDSSYKNSSSINDTDGGSIFSSDIISYKSYTSSHNSDLDAISDIISYSNDSGFGSAENLSNAGSTNIEVQFAPVIELSLAGELLKDIEVLPNRYKGYTELSKNEKDNEKFIVNHQSALSVLSDLGSEHFRNYLPEETIQHFVDVINLNAEQTQKLMGTEGEKKKSEYLIAKTEAKLKGFDLADNCELFEVDCNYHPFIMSAAKEAILALHGQSIKKLEYVAKVINKAIEILQNNPDFDIMVDVTMLENIFRQGDTSLKLLDDGTFVERNSKIAKLSEEDQQKIYEATTKVAEFFMQELDISTNSQCAREFVNETTKAIIKEVEILAKEKTKKEIKIKSKQHDDISKALTSCLEKLDHEDLKDKAEVIIKDFALAIVQKGKVGFNKHFTISKNQLQSIIKEQEDLIQANIIAKELGDTEQLIATELPVSTDDLDITETTEINNSDMITASLAEILGSILLLDEVEQSNISERFASLLDNVFAINTSSEPWLLGEDSYYTQLQEIAVY